MGKLRSGVAVLARRTSASTLPACVFLHVPKCGGTSLTRALQAMYERDRRSVEHVQARALVHLSTARAEARQATLTAAQVHDDRALVASYLLTTGRDDLVTGHFAHTPLTAAAAGDRCWVTMLRHPVDRMLSHFTEHHHHNAPDTPITTAALDEFIDLVDGTRFLTRWFSHGLPDGEPSVDVAIERLTGFAAIGILERPDLTRRQFQRVFGREVHLGTERRSPDPDARRQLQRDDGLRAHLAERLADDIRFYDLAVHLAQDRDVLPSAR